jgi:DNA primase
VRYSPEFLEELRSRVSLAKLIGRRVKLQRRRREHVGLCPFHAERTPSFFVVEQERYFHCFGCGAHGDAIGFVMRADNLNFRTAVAWLAADVDARTTRAVHALPSNHQVAVELHEKEKRNRRIARRLWDEAVDPAGTLVETYLHRRGGLALSPSPVLRFAPCCWNRETSRELPAMLARIDRPNGEFVGVHRTWLTPDGRKATLRDPKMSLGPIRGAAVRLAPPAAVMAIAEGVENALTAIAAGYVAWSAVSAGGIPNVVLPPIVETVLIVADHDANGVGQLAARKATDRWSAEGRRVRLWLSPREGDDLNDILIRSTGGNSE